METKFQKLENALNLLLEINDGITLPNSIYNSLSLAKEVKTVILDAGRQIGKSTLIAKRAEPGDFVIAINSNTVKMLQKLLDFFGARNVQALTVQQLKTFNNPITHSDFTVWVDCASFMKKEEIDDIYLFFGGNAKRFILIG
jgi:hypothetical protein